jgi:response regulator of citrate/malate metabolism
MIDVLVVEDDLLAAEAHRTYVDRVPGFRVTGVAHSGAQALRLLERTPVDLLLLDQYLPDITGLEVCRTLRAARVEVGVIMVTSARDLSVVRAAVSSGVAQYLLKPFTFRTLRDKLERFASFHDTVAGGTASDQSDIDRALATLRSPELHALPKGMSESTMLAVTDALRAAVDGTLTATELGSLVGISRVTARRYLEHLVEIGRAARTPQYGAVGRPELRYRLVR